MRIQQRIAVDTNVLVSRLLLPQSIPAQAVREAIRNGRLLVSEATMNELADVLTQPKPNPYVSMQDRKQFLRQLGRTAELVPTVILVPECRDSSDDKFLELALNGRADLILTGDADVLALHPWREIEILKPFDYLKRT
jgi:putative PIN family toxin of toxin-antitoxin system